jgi:hypothetical protein
MTISYKPLTLCELFISSQYGTGVLQTFLLKLLNFFVWATSCDAPVPHDLALLGDFVTICNDLEKSTSQIYAITQKKLVNLKLPLSPL